LRKKIAVVDPSSYSLPYDYFYINEVSKYYLVDFYYSKTSSNYEYIDKLRDNKNVNLREYNITPSVTNRFCGLINYVLMLFLIFLNSYRYHSIHFIWSIFATAEIPFFLLLRNKLVFTMHNDVPHGYKGEVFFPFRIISKIVPTLVFVSKFTRDRFRTKYGLHKNVKIAQHGLMPIASDKELNQVSSSRFGGRLVFWGRVEGYKGLDFFERQKIDLPLDIYGRWSSSMSDLKQALSKNNNICIVDRYLSHEELLAMLLQEHIYILPYKAATQSGVLYTLLTYEKVFISSNVGENYQFLITHGLEKLSFDRDCYESFQSALRYAVENYLEIKMKLKIIKESYRWSTVLDHSVVNDIYLYHRL